VDTRSTLEVLLDIEFDLITKFGWSLVDIDATDCVSLFDMMRRVSQRQRPRDVFAEDVAW
jgi:hypothetical protein